MTVGIYQAGFNAGIEAAARIAEQLRMGQAVEFPTEPKRMPLGSMMLNPAEAQYKTAEVIARCIRNSAVKPPSNG